jgi:hypothetical protein
MATLPEPYERSTHEYKNTAGVINIENFAVEPSHGELLHKPEKDTLNVKFYQREVDPANPKTVLLSVMHARSVCNQYLLECDLQALLLGRVHHKGATEGLNQFVNPRPAKLKSVWINANGRPNLDSVECVVRHHVWLIGLDVSNTYFPYELIDWIDQNQESDDRRYDVINGINGTEWDSAVTNAQTAIAQYGQTRPTVIVVRASDVCGNNTFGSIATAALYVGHSNSRAARSRAANSSSISSQFFARLNRGKLPSNQYYVFLDRPVFVSVCSDHAHDFHRASKSNQSTGLDNLAQADARMKGFLDAVASKNLHVKGDRERMMRDLFQTNGKVSSPRDERMFINNVTLELYAYALKLRKGIKNDSPPSEDLPYLRALTHAAQWLCARSNIMISKANATPLNTLLLNDKKHKRLLAASDALMAVSE